MHLVVERNRKLSNDRWTASVVKVYPNPDDQTQVATFEGIERPWKNNEDDTSCIPDGDYQLVPHKGKYGRVWAFVGETVSHYEEPGKARFACLIHNANWADQLEGCLAIGRGVNPNTPRGRMVLNSLQAVTALRKIMPPTAPHTASIRWI